MQAATLSSTNNRPVLALIAAGLVLSTISALVLQVLGTLGWLP